MPAHELSAVLLAGTLTVTAAVALGEKTHVWWMTESGVAILVGMFVGLAMWLYAVAQDDVEEETAALEALEFNPEIFTLLLLPPIIFESGFALNHRFFFSNIGSILVFAFLGTLVAFSVLAPSLYYGLGGANGLLTPMEACAFAALVSAVDPVATLAIFSSTGADPKLNALIFGESVLNDAVAIVLFKTVVQLGKHGVGVSTALGVADVAGAVGSFMLIFAGSCLVGVLGGTLIALFFKMTALRKLDAHAAPIAELICLICLSYATFLVAEYARLSGIVAALFAGAVCVMYVKKNLTEEGAALCVTVIHAVAKFAETIIFVLIGCGFWLYLVGKIRPLHSSNHTLIEPPCVETTKDEMEPAFIVLTLSLCLLSRACSVFPMAMLANCCRSADRKIRLNEQAVIWFSGLRGAIALALAVEFPTAEEVVGTEGAGSFCHQREHVVACTIVVVLATVFLMGGFTKPVLQLCGISMGNTKAKEPPRAPGNESRRWWKRAIINFERSFLRPVLIADYHEQAREALEARRALTGGESTSHRGPAESGERGIELQGAI